MSSSHCESVFVSRLRVCSDLSDLHAAVPLFQRFEEAVVSPCVFLPPLLKVNCPQVRGFICGLSVLPH